MSAIQHHPSKQSIHPDLRVYRGEHSDLDAGDNGVKTLPGSIGAYFFNYVLIFLIIASLNSRKPLILMAISLLQVKKVEAHLKIFEPSINNLMVSFIDQEYLSILGT